MTKVTPREGFLIGLAQTVIKMGNYEPSASIEGWKHHKEDDASKYNLEQEGEAEQQEQRWGAFPASDIY